MTRIKTLSWRETIKAVCITSRPAVCARVMTGRPTAPKAVGVVLATKQITAASMGLMPKVIRIEAGMATAVPKPAIASRNPPKPQAISNTKIRLSVVRLQSMSWIFCMAPDLKVTLEVNMAATMM